MAFVSRRKTLVAAFFVLEQMIGSALANCMCDPYNPYCFGKDRFCYTNPDSRTFSHTVCAGVCTADYTPNVDEYHYVVHRVYDQTGSEIPQKTYEKHERPTPPPITQADVDAAVKAEKDSLNKAEEAIHNTTIYQAWLYGGVVSTAKYQDDQAEQIKVIGFAKVDAFRQKIEANLSLKVEELAALSQKVGSDPTGGTLHQQEELQKLVANIDNDRKRLQDFDFTRKVKELHFVWSEARNGEMNREESIRNQNFATRMHYLETAKMSHRVQGRWGRHDLGNPEGTFNWLEQTAEPKQDSCSEQIGKIYRNIWERVQHRITLLEAAAAADERAQDADTSLLYA